MPSRRQQIQLDPGEMGRFLDTEKTLIVVSNRPDGFPHPMPMWFYADAAGVVRCTTFSRSQKVVNLTRDPRASLLVESGEEYARLKGLVIYADTEIVTDRQAVVDTLVKINTRGRDPAPAEVEKLREAVSKTAQKRVVLRFTPQRYVSWDHAKLGGRY